MLGRNHWSCCLDLMNFTASLKYCSWRRDRTEVVKPGPRSHGHCLYSYLSQYRAQWTAMMAISAAYTSTNKTRIKEEVFDTAKAVDSCARL